MVITLLTLIPARGGSKGIPRKNIQELCGKPLIAWSIEAAQKSKYIDRIIISTDDQEIADVARSYGAEVPFLRPVEIAQDDTLGISPVIHALEQFPKFEQVLLLQPTSPLRTTDDIDGIVKMFQESQAPAAVSICETSKHPNWMFSCDKDGTLKPFTAKPIATRRQELPKVYHLNGALYLAKSEWLRKTHTFLSPETLGYVMPPERSADIDTLLDWEWVELLIKRSIL